MARYRKRPIEIEAERNDSGTPIYIETREGVMRADPGDWIITGVEGERYPCKPSIFETTYELVVRHLVQKKEGNSNEDA